MSIVFVDIDGTLLDSRKGIPDSATYAIKKAQENGHKICICTGRPKPDVDEEDKAQIVKLSIFSRNPSDFEAIRKSLPESCSFMSHTFGGTDIYNGEISLTHITKVTGKDRPTMVFSLWLKAYDFS